MMAFVALIVILAAAPAFGADWAEACGDAVDPATGEVRELARPYRLYHGIPVFLGACQKKPGSQAQKSIVTEEGCEVRMDPTGAFAAQETRSLYADPRGTLRLVRPCAVDWRTARKYPVVVSALRCPMSFDLATQTVWRWRRKAYSKDGVLYPLGACADDRVEHMPFKAAACADATFDGRVLAMARLLAEDGTEIIACAPVPGQTVGDYHVVTSPEGCAGYLTHRREIATSFGSARALMRRGSENFVVDSSSHRLVDLAHAAEGQGCTADIAQAIPQVDLKPGAQDDDRLLVPATAFDGAETRLGCAVILPRIKLWQAVRSDGSVHAVPGPRIDPAFRLDRCETK